MSTATGEAELMVGAAYRALDLFGGRYDALAAWAARLPAAGPQAGLLPPNFGAETRAILAQVLADAGVLQDGERVDAYRLRGFQRVVEMIPAVRQEELRRLPAPRSELVLTLPPEVQLPQGQRHLASTLLALLGSVLLSAEERVLLASPYWSVGGNGLLLPFLNRAIQLCLPVLLVGARVDDDRHREAMVALGRGIVAQGGAAEALAYRGPRHTSLFHAKLVAGRRGYLGSANLTRSGLGEHVELGVPLREVDVEWVWSIVDLLRACGLFEAVPL